MGRSSARRSKVTSSSPESRIITPQTKWWLDLLEKDSEQEALAKMPKKAFPLSYLMTKKYPRDGIISVLYQKAWHQMNRILIAQHPVLLTPQKSMLVPIREMIPRKEYRDYLLDRIFYLFPAYLQNTPIRRLFVQFFTPEHLTLSYWQEKIRSKKVSSTAPIVILDQLLDSCPHFFSEWIVCHQHDPQLLKVLPFIYSSSRVSRYLPELPDQLLVDSMPLWFPLLVDYIYHLPQSEVERIRAFLPLDTATSELELYWRDSGMVNLLPRRALLDRLQEISIPWKMSRFIPSYYQELVQRDQAVGTVLQEPYWQTLGPLRFEDFIVDHSLRNSFYFRENGQFRSFYSPLSERYRRHLLNQALDRWEEEVWDRYLSTLTHSQMGFKYPIFNACVRIFGFLDITGVYHGQEEPNLRRHYTQQIFKRLLLGNICSDSDLPRYGSELISQMAQHYWDQLEARFSSLQHLTPSEWTYYLHRQWQSKHYSPQAVQKGMLGTQVRDQSGTVQILYHRLKKLGGAGFQDYYWDRQIWEDSSFLLWPALESAVDPSSFLSSFATPPTWDDIVTLDVSEYSLEELNPTDPEGNPFLLRLLKQPTLQPYLLKWAQNNYQIREQMRSYLQMHLESGMLFLYPHLIRLVSTPAPLSQPDLLQIGLPTLAHRLRRALTTHKRLPPGHTQPLEWIQEWLSRPVDIFLGKCQLCHQDPQHLQLKCCPHRVCVACNQWCHHCPWCQTLNSSFHLLPISPDSLWASPERDPWVKHYLIQ